MFKTPIRSALTQSAQGDALDPPTLSTGGTQSTVPHQAPSLAVGQGEMIHPKTPIMGGIIQSSEDEFSAWTGGKPKANWSGLVDPAGVMVMHVLTQVWPMYVSASAKAYLHQITRFASKMTLNGAN